MTTEEEQKILKSKFSEDMIQESDDFKSYFDKYFASDQDFELRLYRYENKKKTFLREYYCERPNEPQIGDEFGGGSYYLMGIDPVTRKTRSKYIHIDQLYTKKLKERERDELRLTQPGAPQAREDPFNIALKILDVFKPILEQAMKSNSRAAPVMGGTEKMMQPIMENVIKSFTQGFGMMGKTMIENQQEIMNHKITAEKTQEFGNTIAGEIVGLVKDLGAKYLESKKSIMDVIQDGKIPADKMSLIMKASQQDINEVYNALCDDPTVGEEKTNNIFTKLGINVDIEPEPQAENNEPSQPNQ